MKILTLDIETSPNLAHVWQLYQTNVGINQIIESSYVMCWAAKWYGKKKIMFSSVHEDEPKVMIKKIYDLICEADAIITYNGVKFDMRTLNKEFIKYDLEPPSPYKNIDLIKKGYACNANRMYHRVVCKDCGKWGRKNKAIKNFNKPEYIIGM